MNIRIIAFVIWACVLSAFLFLFVNRQTANPWTGLMQTGDTSIGRYSFDWMGALALIGAVVICCFVD